MADEEKKEWFGQRFGWTIREDQIAQPHESLRKMVNRAHGRPYYALSTLEEAIAYPDGLVIFEGDYGGQIYLICPAEQVKCNEETLKQLLTDIDTIKWDDPSGARIYFERQPVGSGIAGGMGGGPVTGTLWVHNQLVQEQLDGLIRNVLQGELSRLPEEIRSRKLGAWKRPKPEEPDNN